MDKKPANKKAKPIPTFFIGDWVEIKHLRQEGSQSSADRLH